MVDKYAPLIEEQAEEGADSGDRYGGSCVVCVREVEKTALSTVSEAAQYSDRLTVKAVKLQFVAAAEVPFFATDSGPVSRDNSVGIATTLDVRKVKVRFPNRSNGCFCSPKHPYWH
jgi:hypothetical protein